MIFTENRYDRSMEKMMKGIPNFYPRGSGIVVTGKIQCCECGRNYRKIKTRKGEIVWRCAGQVEHTSECQSRTIKQAEIDEYTRSILQIDTETIDTNSLIEKITVDKNAFKIIVDSTVLS